MLWAVHKQCIQWLQANVISNTVFIYSLHKYHTKEAPKWVEAVFSNSCSSVTYDRYTKKRQTSVSTETKADRNNTHTTMRWWRHRSWMSHTVSDIKRQWFTQQVCSLSLPFTFICFLSLHPGILSSHHNAPYSSKCRSDVYKTFCNSIKWWTLNNPCCKRERERLKEERQMMGSWMWFRKWLLFPEAIRLCSCAFHHRLHRQPCFILLSLFVLPPFFPLPIAQNACCGWISSPLFASSSSSITCDKVPATEPCLMLHIEHLLPWKQMLALANSIYLS